MDTSRKWTWNSRNNKTRRREGKEELLSEGLEGRRVEEAGVGGKEREEEGERNRTLSL
jgi:hypothetical protein